MEYGVTYALEGLNAAWNGSTVIFAVLGINFAVLVVAMGLVSFVYHKLYGGLFR